MRFFWHHFCLVGGSMTLSNEQFRYATYYAPRGKVRMQNLGNLVSQKYLLPNDRIIGLIGDAGSGKSLFIKGMFPGLELTNDDDGINTRPSPLMRDYAQLNYRAHTYHIDVRFEAAFTQMFELVDALNQALVNKKRIVIEHFDDIYPYMNINADLLIGIGEEVIVARPNLFGPIPEDIKTSVYKSIQYRRMAHSAEDLLVHVLAEDYNINCDGHGDVKHGFILSFYKKPKASISVLEKKVKALIKEDLTISYHDSTHIKIGDSIDQYCTGPRTHVNHTAQIKNFRLLKDYIFDPQKKTYELVGIVSDETIEDIHKINHFAE